MLVSPQAMRANRRNSATPQAMRANRRNSATPQATDATCTRCFTWHKTGEHCTHTKHATPTVHHTCPWPQALESRSLHLCAWGTYSPACTPFNIRMPCYATQPDRACQRIKKQTTFAAQRTKPPFPAMLAALQTLFLITLQWEKCIRLPGSTGATIRREAYFATLRVQCLLLMKKCLSTLLSLLRRL